MDPWSTKDHVVGERAIKYSKGNVQVHTSNEDRECDVSDGELLLSVEANEDGKTATNVGFVDFHILKCVHE